MRRVLVTGAGAVTALGPTLDATCAALHAGQSALGTVESFGARHFSRSLGAEVPDFDARPHFTAPKAMKLADRRSRFAVAAASMALADSGWTGGREALGVLVGTSGSDVQVGEVSAALAGDADGRAATDIRYFAERVLTGLNPLWLIVNLPNMASAHVAIQLQALGPNSTVMTDWAAGAQALGEAASWVAEGEAEAVLAGGGADTGLHAYAWASLEQSGRLDEGFVPGEGAAMMLLEGAESARSRGARVLGELCGYGSAGGGDVDALCDAMAGALDAAGWRAGAVDVVAVAGVRGGGLLGMERAAHDRVFAARPPERFDLRERLGHPLAASGAIEVAVLLRGLPAGRTLLCTALGHSGQAAALALRAGGEA